MCVLFVGWDTSAMSETGGIRATAGGAGCGDLPPPHHCKPRTDPVSSARVICAVSTDPSLLSRLLLFFKQYFLYLYILSAVFQNILGGRGACCPYHRAVPVTMWAFLPHESTVKPVQPVTCG